MTNDTAPARFAGIDHPGQTHEFRMEIVYENPAVGVPALNLCEHLIEQFHDTFALSVATHSFKAIEAELHARKCLRPGADMIFVASAGTVPTAFLQWLNRCMELSQEQAPIALVDMTRHETPNADRIHEFLKRAAQVHHLDHFSKEHFETLPSTTSTSSVPSPVSVRRVRHWGINE